MSSAQEQNRQRLGTRFRGKLADAYGLRGKGQSSLWYVYSPKTARDWVLQDDLAFDHFVLIESDLDIVSADYAPEGRMLIDTGKEIEVPLTAIVTRKSGIDEWRVIRRTRDMESRAELAQQFTYFESLLASAGIQYRMLSEDDIRANQQHMLNWRRIIVWISAARGYALDQSRERVMKLLRKKGFITLRELEASVGEIEFPIVAAALFTELQRGSVEVNLSLGPINPDTLVTLKAT